MSGDIEALLRERILIMDGGSRHHAAAKWYDARTMPGIVRG